MTTTSLGSRIAYLASTLATLVITGSFTLSSMTLGSVLFAGTGGLVSQDNANFFWDDTNNRLGIGTATPGGQLEVHNTGSDAFGARIISTGGGDSGILFGRTGTNGAGIQMMSSSPDDMLVFKVNGTTFPTFAATPMMTLASTGFLGLGTGTTSAASKFEIFQTPTNANGTVLDSQRILISGSTNSNLARGIDWSYGGAAWATISSNASSGKHLLYAAQPNNYWALESNITTSTSVPATSLANNTAFSASSGSQVGVKVNHTINQTSTAAFDSLLINRVNTAVGSGNQNFLNLTVSDALRFRVDTGGHVFMDATVTAGGTTGNQTINKPSGTVNFAAAATAITVTNSTVSTSSIVNGIARTNDATCSVKNIVPGSGSFVINMTAACTAETSVGWVVFN